MSRAPPPPAFSRIAARAVAAGLLLCAGLPGTAWTQQVTVSGVIVETSRSATIGGATVRLSDRPPFFTDLDGAFHFTGVDPGAHVLTVQAMGYRPRSLNILVRADTLLVIEMEPDPIQLDSLVVEGGTITLRGRIRDVTTGDRVLYAQVTVSPGFPTVGATSGEFRVRKVPKGQTVYVLVEAMEYLPARIALIAESDTTLKVELEPDSVAMRMVAQEVEKLEKRSRALPFRRRIMDPGDLARYPGWPAYELLRQAVSMMGVGPSRVQVNLDHPACLFIDDVQQISGSFLWGIDAGQVARIEIIDQGGMVRVYTKPYLFSLMGREPRPIFYTKTGLMGPVCH